MIQFKVDVDRITVDELIALEEGEMKAREMRNFLARFVVGEDGQSPEAEAARQQVGGMTLAELKEAIREFGKRVQADANPKETGSSS